MKVELKFTMTIKMFYIVLTHCLLNMEQSATSKAFRFVIRQLRFVSEFVPCQVLSVS